MKKFRCTVCGEIIEEGMTACPVCKVGPDKWEEIKEDEAQIWASEHKIGEGLDSKDEEIINGLRANFEGECTEVGMYLAMSRVADREGYPEIAEAYKRYAFEEAEHAAKFAELLGECVSDSTEVNLSKRVEAEFGACSGKFTLAKRAKMLGFDAIHDTVHEMAKDEARHGKGMAGLLKRYFNK